MPMLGDYTASESLVERDLDDPAANPLPPGPAAVETFAEVASESYESGFDVAPEILRTQRPHYPPRALADQVQGSAWRLCSRSDSSPPRETE
jgi:hypothetical protein